MIWLLALLADHALSLTVHKVVITLILVIVHTIWLVIISIITRVLSNSVSMCLTAVYIKSEVKSGSNFWSAFVLTISSSCRNGTMSNSSLSKIIYWCPVICLNKIQRSPWFLSKMASLNLALKSSSLTSKVLSSVTSINIFNPSWKSINPLTFSPLTHKTSIRAL